MPVQTILRSPYPFPERLLLFGGGGAGKTRAVLSIARYLPDAHFHVLDTDISAAYERSLYLSFPDVLERNQVTVYTIDEWADFVSGTTKIVDVGDHDKDWLVFDNCTWSWDAVQAWMSDQVQGEDIADFMRRVKIETKDNVDQQGKSTALRDFNAQIAEGMSWPLINKEYRRKVLSRLHKWHGNMILVCEADAIRKPSNNESQDDKELRAAFGFLGIRPKGQKALHHVAATNIFMYQRGPDDWRMTTAKDRDRERMKDAMVDDFAMDYLHAVAGWEKRLWKPTNATKEVSDE